LLVAVGQEDRRSGIRRDRDPLLLAPKVALMRDAAPAEPTLWIAARARFVPRAQPGVPVKQGCRTFSSAVVRGSRLKSQHEADPRFDFARPFLSRWATSMPSNLWSPRWTVETPEQVHQGGLPGARRPHDGDELALVDRERDAVQRANLDPAHRVDPDEVVDL
jgi:hypothetical protein